MRKLALIFSSALLISGACGDDGDDGDTPDAAAQADAAPQADAPAQADAMGNPAVTGLGQFCNPGNACPAMHTCIVGIGAFTGPSMDSGYCTPSCGDGVAPGDDALCTGPYTGPATSTPACLLTAMGQTEASSCAILCSTATQDCPGGLTCHDIGGGNSVCGAPDWVMQ